MKKTSLSTDRLVLPHQVFINRMNQLSFKELSDSELKYMLFEETDEDAASEALLAKCYAMLKEIVFRCTGLSLFDTQLAAAYAMQKGHIAELPTGEGKTLSAVVSAICFALRGKDVHILVFNDYLAKRDYLWYRSIYDFCGLSAGYIDQHTTRELRKEIYTRKIVYLTVKEAGFDNLKDFLCDKNNDIISPEYDVAIVDEADSIFIDEAKTPLVLAGDMPEEYSRKNNIKNIVYSLTDEDVVTDYNQKQVYLSDIGINRIEAILGIENLYDESNAEVLSLLNAAMSAKYLLILDKDYIIKDNSIQVVDELTGRIAVNRKFPDILHHAVEAKENITENDQTMIFNSTTIRSFLSNYETLCGMTGTINTSKDEIWNLYGLDIDVIPPHIPCIRKDREDIVYFNDSDREEAVINELKNAYAKGQPVLLGTKSVSESERFSAILSGLNIPHSVLNARNDEEEAEMIAKAGEPFRVTVSTNMAGRGVDIKLGGINEKDKEAVVAAGGLYIIGVGINRSLRIDKQLSGRAGRQGDPGESKFFLSLDDDLLKPYADEKDWSRYASPGKPITEKSIVKWVRRIQKYSEGEDAEARYMLEKYSIILEQQRKLVSNRHAILLDGIEPSNILFEREQQYYDELIEKCGSEGVKLAEKQLMLYFLNRHWADYLESMEDVRNGIHLMVVGGKKPLTEYHRIAIAAFDEMMEEINYDVIESMKKYDITENGIDMKAAGLIGATSTRTYMIDESNSQFRRIPQLLKTVSNRIDGTVFTVHGLFEKVKILIKTSKNK
ncbi:MAG: accessory Sec system translocase SecA2 [Eubacteriales bacterium]